MAEWLKLGCKLSTLGTSTMIYLNTSTSEVI